MGKKRNNSIDAMRIITAFVVVNLHFPMLDFFSARSGINYGHLIKAIGLYAVPFYFMVTGYYFDLESDYLHVSKYVKSKVLYFLNIFVLSYIFCIVSNALYIGLLEHGNAGYYVGQVFSWESIKECIVFNEVGFQFGGPLWYLVALMEGYIVLLLLKKYDLVKYETCIIVYCLLINLCLGELCKVLNVYNNGKIIGGFWLTRAVPYLLLGHYIKNNYDKLKRVDGLILAALMVISIMLIIGERVLLRTFDVFEYAGHYQGTTLFVFVLFLILLKNPNIVSDNNILCHLGLEYALYVYVLHAPVGFTFIKLVSQDSFWFLFKSVFIFMISLLIAILLKKVSKVLYRKSC